MNPQIVFNYQQEINQLKSEFNFDFVALALVQPAEHRFELKWEYAIGNRSDRYRRIVLQTGKGVAGNVFKTGKPLLVTDVEKGLNKVDLFNYPIVIAEGLTSFGAIPLYKYNRVKGVLLVAFRDEQEVTPDLFLAFQKAVGPKFGPYYNKEMVRH